MDQTVFMNIWKVCKQSGNFEESIKLLFENILQNPYKFKLKLFNFLTLIF